MDIIPQTSWTSPHLTEIRISIQVIIVPRTSTGWKNWCKRRPCIMFLFLVAIFTYHHMSLWPSWTSPHMTEIRISIQVIIVPRTFTGWNHWCKRRPCIMFIVFGCHIYLSSRHFGHPNHGGQACISFSATQFKVCTSFTKNDFWRLFWKSYKKRKERSLD